MVILSREAQKKRLNTNIIHIGFVACFFVILSCYFFDITDRTERSFAFFSLFIMTVAYVLNSSWLTGARFSSGTDLESAGAFSTVCLTWWVAITNYFFAPDQLSKITGIFLIVAAFSAFNLSTYLLYLTKNTSAKGHIPWFVVRPTQMIMVASLGASFYFFAYGSWEFHIDSPLDYLDRIVHGY